MPSAVREQWEDGVSLLQLCLGLSPLSLRWLPLWLFCFLFGRKEPVWEFPELSGKQSESPRSSHPGPRCHLFPAGGWGQQLAAIQSGPCCQGSPPSVLTSPRLVGGGGIIVKFKRKNVCVWKASESSSIFTLAPWASTSSCSPCPCQVCRQLSSQEVRLFWTRCRAQGAPQAAPLQSLMPEELGLTLPGRVEGRGHFLILP